MWEMCKKNFSQENVRNVWDYFSHNILTNFSHIFHTWTRKQRKDGCGAKKQLVHVYMNSQENFLNMIFYNFYIVFSSVLFEKISHISCVRYVWEICEICVRSVWEILWETTSHKISHMEGKIFMRKIFLQFFYVH